MRLSRCDLPAPLAADNKNRPHPGAREQSTCQWQGNATKASAAHPAGEPARLPHREGAAAPDFSLERR
jgi:hypothetical protein